MCYRNHRKSLLSHDSSEQGWLRPWFLPSTAVVDSKIARASVRIYDGNGSQGLHDDGDYTWIAWGLR